ncbi:MAG: alpha/beta hydrolase [Tepidamorphaceae bacterium]|nr:alpha/beta hydrolase [Rhodobiaceae bacterium]MCC0048890.1 alpha/beta hydrolase [Rhodobiaceae bacterium]
MHSYHSFHSGDVEIAYIDTGPGSGAEGKTILLIHGFASNIEINWVGTGWVDTLSQAGFRVVAIDNRGHGKSEKLYDKAQYGAPIMAEDARLLLDHLDIGRADVMGYSMGARITAFLSMGYPDRVRSAIFGGLGIGMVKGVGAPEPIAEALEADDPGTIPDQTALMFRKFAEATGSDLAALAACIRSARIKIREEALANLRLPVLVCVGSKDDIAGSPYELADIIPGAEAFEIAGRDHNRAVGDKAYKQAVLDFLDRRP